MTTILDIDEAHLRRLIIAKMVFVHGLYHAALKDQVDRMVSIHHFDSANEIMLRLLADMSGRPYDENSFTAVFNAARAAFVSHAGKGTLPEAGEVLELHKIRNRIQHGAIAVDQSTVDRFKHSTENFLSGTLKSVFGQTIPQISLASLIQNAELRTLIERAERHFDKREFVKCIEVCDDVLVKATFESGDVIGKAGLLTGYWGADLVRKMIDEKRFLRRYKGVSRELAREFSKAILELGRIATSMQFLDHYRGDFLRHRELVKNMDRLSEDEVRDGAARSLEFLTNIILKWQSEGILS